MKLKTTFVLFSLSIFTTLFAFELVLDEDTKIMQTMKKLDEYYDQQTWNQDEASQYLDKLVRKHGSSVRHKMEQFTQDVGSVTAQKATQQIKSNKKWFVGEPRLAKFDKPVFESMVTKLKSLFPSSSSLLDGWKFQDLGIYFVSIRDTNIFDEGAPQ